MKEIPIRKYMEAGNKYNNVIRTKGIGWTY